MKPFRSRRRSHRRRAAIPAVKGRRNGYISADVIRSKLLPVLGLFACGLAVLTLRNWTVHSRRTLPQTTTVDVLAMTAPKGTIVSPSSSVESSGRQLRSKGAPRNLAPVAHQSPSVPKLSFLSRCDEH